MEKKQVRKKERWPEIEFPGGTLSANMGVITYIYKGLEGPVNGPVPLGRAKFMSSGGRIVWGEAEEMLKFLKNTELANQTALRLKYLPQENIIQVLFGYRMVEEFSTRKPVPKPWLPALKLAADALKVPDGDKVRMFNSYPPKPKQEEPAEVTRSLDILELSGRTQKVLEDADITTVEGLLELFQKGDDVVLALDNVGERSLEEIKGALESLESKSKSEG